MELLGQMAFLTATLVLTTSICWVKSILGILATKLILKEIVEKLKGRPRVFIPLTRTDKVSYCSLMRHAGKEYEMLILCI